jgi:putative Mg2+ transporter-C (MgtC) family protein
MANNCSLIAYNANREEHEMESWQLTNYPELDMVIRLVIAAFIGGVIGYERAKAGKAAGLRTNLLVCVGAALFTVISIYGFGENGDPSRVAAGVVVGIGFLGAGTILRQEKTVAGLTTAATIWSVAAIGLAVGAGLYVVAGVAAVLVPVALRFLPHHHPMSD